MDLSSAWTRWCNFRVKFRDWQKWWVSDFCPRELSPVWSPNLRGLGGVQWQLLWMIGLLLSWFIKVWSYYYIAMVAKMAMAMRSQKGDSNDNFDSLPSLMALFVVVTVIQQTEVWTCPWMCTWRTSSSPWRASLPFPWITSPSEAITSGRGTWK